MTDEQEIPESIIDLYLRPSPLPTFSATGGRMGRAGAPLSIRKALEAVRDEEEYLLVPTPETAERILANVAHSERILSRKG